MAECLVVCAYGRGTLNFITLFAQAAPQKINDLRAAFDVLMRMLTPHMTEVSRWK